MLPEVVIVASGTHWHCVTCKLQNKRTVSLDQHLKQNHPPVPNEPPKASVPASALFDMSSVPASALCDRASVPASALCDKQSVPASALCEKESVEDVKDIFYVEPPKANVPAPALCDKQSVPVSALCDKESVEGFKDIVNIEYNTNKKQPTLSPISPWLRQLPQQDFGEDISDVGANDNESDEDFVPSELEDIETDEDFVPSDLDDNETDEDFVPSELEDKGVKLPSRSRRLTQKQSNNIIKYLTVCIPRITTSNIKHSKHPLVNPDLVSEVEAVSEVQAVSEFEPPTEPEKTEPNDTDDVCKPKAKRGRLRRDETVSDGHKPNSIHGRHRISHNSPAQPQPTRKRGHPSKTHPPPAEDQEMPSKRRYRRVLDSSEKVLTICNVKRRKPNTRKKLSATDKVGMKEKYTKWISEGEPVEALSKKNQVEGDESSLDNRAFGDSNGDSVISPDSISSQDISLNSHEHSNSGTPSRERVRCNTCLNLFNSDVHLREHLRTVSSEDIIQCLQCEMKFHGMTDLNMHVFCVHEYDKQPMCFACRQEFKSMEKLEKHLYRHVEDTDRKLESTRFHDCRLCSMELNVDFQLINKHYYNRHKAYVCRECYGKSVELLYYTDKHFYNEHKQVHANSPAECVICKMVFPTSRDMKKHMWTHAEDKTEDGTGGKCSKCDTWFPNAGAMLMHTKKHKSEARKKSSTLTASTGFPCMKCEHIFSSNRNLKKHPCKADPNRTYLFHCEYCAHGCYSEIALRDHIALRHLCIKQYSCRDCDQRFGTEPTLQRHIRKQHTHEKPYKCHLCEDRFYERNDMLRHVNQHTGTRFTCELCDKGFHTKLDLKHHVQKHTRNFVCPTCGRTYKRNDHLKRHIRRKHTHTDEKPYECHLCGDRFKDSNLLARHINKHTGIRFKCELCDKSFHIKSELKRHVKYHNGDFDCPHCDRGFKIERHLKRHVQKQHTHEKPYGCHLCGDRFYDHNAMLRHVNKHNGIIFKCEVCDKGFHTEFDLKQHVRHHTASPHFFCPTCRRGFKQKHHLKQHLEKSCKKTMIQFDENIPSVTSAAPLAASEDDDVEISIDQENHDSV